jgi:hypothetical protein
MTEVLQIIHSQLEGLGLNYEFGRMTQSPPSYPYWVGDYTEPESMTEDGLENPTILLTGFTRGSYIELETDKKKMKDHFKHGVSVITESGAAVVIFYAGSFGVPTDELELKKVQVNLQIKSWKGN